MQKRTIRLLTVGNSFSLNATRYLVELSKAAGYDLILGHADIGGCSLARHWGFVEAAQKPYTVNADGLQVQRSLDEILQSDRWDIVTIQQYSAISHDPDTYMPYAEDLRDYIKQFAPQAEIVMHQTWAYRCDDPRFADGEDSQDNMYAALKSAYQSTACKHGLRVIPVGDSFHAADTDAAWRYVPVDFNPDGAAYPDLPDQTHSLHVGLRWLKDENGGYQLGMDGHHASPTGCYLAGCVWFEFIFNKSVVDNGYVPRDVLTEDASVMRRVAHQVMHARRNSG
jgi:hypothetical protein